MARSIPAKRFDELVRCATEVFISRGYRQTQMSDIAEAVGVAKGTLYGYVESKDTLLALCLAFADSSDQVEVPESLPLPALPPLELGRRVKESLAAETQQPILDRALARTSAEEIEAELREVIGEFFDLMFGNRHRVKLLDRCMDHPELQNLWQVRGRVQSQSAMKRYLASRIEAGQIRPVADLGLTARFVIESVATWAVHIHWDRAPEVIAPKSARNGVIDLLVRALAV